MNQIVTGKTPGSLNTAFDKRHKQPAILPRDRSIGGFYTPGNETGGVHETPRRRNLAANTKTRDKLFVPLFVPLLDIIKK